MCPYGFVASLGCRTRPLVGSCLPKIKKAEDSSALTGTWLELPRGENLFEEGFPSQIVAIVDSDDYLNNLICI